MNKNNLKTVAIIGRANVGKSTLFNRLIGERRAIETPIPGTTRDRLFGDVSWRGQDFTLIDVAGVEFGKKIEIDKNIQDGVLAAMNSADLLLFVVDWNDKGNEIDKRVAAILRKSKKKVILTVNKADNLERIKHMEEFRRLGNFEIVPVSAISGKNSGDLLDIIAKDLSKIKIKTTKEKENKDLIKLAIVGRPNVGKSTLINSIVGEKRAVVSSEPGTTRDSLSVLFKHKGKDIKIIDTAGIRRRGKIVKDTIESFASLRAMRSLRECNIAIIVIDGTEGLVSREASILGQAVEWGKGVILAVNKVDLWKKNREEMAKTLWILQKKLNFTPWLPIVFISAQQQKNTKPLLDQVMKVWINRNQVIEQDDLDLILDQAKASNAQLVNFSNIRQKKTNPPTFEVSYNDKKIPHKTQVRYLENKIRDIFPLNGSPIFLDLVNSSKKRRNKRIKR